ncbi:hypothetical protein FRC00_003292 [Tulasnella sp. 408]|nr:hypothetical protein FRC00_003292 [Tulasnella sp. 408]
MEAYAITEIYSLMTNDQEGLLPKVVHPVQSFGYPGGETAHHVEVLDPPSGPLNFDLVNRDSQFYLGIHLNRSAQWIRLHVQLDSDSSSTKFTSSTQLLLNTRAVRTFAYCWGVSGERILLAVWYRPGWNVLCAVAPSDLNSCSPEYGDQVAVQWDASPKLEQDFFAGFAFDDSSGMCAVATSAGRVWIDDYFKPPVATCKLLEEGLHLGEVEHYFPMMNDPNCYGGAKWFVNEALHISGSATLVMFTISALYPRKWWSTRIIRVTGGRLIAVETDLDMQSYRVKLLGPDITLTQVPILFPEYLSIEGAAGVDLDVDYAVVRRYAFWRNEVEGKPDGFPPGYW